MHFPLSRDCMQKVSSLVRRTALSRVMICTGALILSIAEITPHPQENHLDRKTIYSEFDRLDFQRCQPILPSPTYPSVWLFAS